MSDLPLTLIRSAAPPTQLQVAPGIADGLEVFLKREDCGPNRSFKWRGALVACERFREAGERSVVTASTGNHGAAVAWAARRLGLKAWVVVPEDALAEKCRLIEEHGATLHRHGTNLDEAADAARLLAKQSASPYFEDGGLEAQLLGTATIGVELAEHAPDTVILPLGCGALAAGLARSLKEAVDSLNIIAVQSAAFARFSALFHGEPDPVRPTGTTIADGLAENRIIEPAFTTCKQYLDEIVTVSDPELVCAMRLLWHHSGILAEPAAAAPLAALQRYPDLVVGQRIVLVISGGNIDAELARSVTGPDS